MDFGDHNLGIRSIVLELGNDGMGFGGSDIGFGNDDMCIYNEFGLGIPSQQPSYKDNDGTHVEDLKNPVKVQLPGGNFFLVILCMQVSRKRVSFVLFDDLLLDLPNSPEITSRTSSTSCSKRMSAV